MQHLHVTFGVIGAVEFRVDDMAPGTTVLHYNAVGDMGSSSSVKVGHSSVISYAIYLIS